MRYLYLGRLGNGTIDRGGWHIWPKKRGEEVGLTEDETVDTPVTFDEQPLPAISDVD